MRILEESVTVLRLLYTHCTDLLNSSGPTHPCSAQMLLLYLLETALWPKMHYRQLE